MHPVKQAYVLVHQLYSLTSDLGDVSDNHTAQCEIEQGECAMKQLLKSKAKRELLVED